jgi:hypothetical protein
VRALRSGALLDGEFGVVAVAGDDRVLLGFAFFVLHAQGVAFVVDQEDLDLAVAAVVLVVGGTVGEDVLVADGVVDLGEDVGERALEHRVEAEAAGHCGEGVELILRLEVVEVAYAAAHSATAAGYFVDQRTGADGKDGDVGGGLDLGEDLVEGELGEGVAARADEDDVLAAFDASGAVEGLVEGVEEVGVGEAGDDEGLEGLGDEVLVVGEVGEDVGPEVVGDDGDVVVLAQGTEEAVRGIPHVINEVVAVGGKFKQHDCSDGGLGDTDAGDGLGDAVLEDEEVVGLEAGDKLVGLVEDDVGVDVDDGDVDTEGVGITLGVFNFGGGRSDGRRRGLFCLLLFLEDDGAVVGLGAGVVGWRWGGLGLLFGRRWGVLSVGARQWQEEGAGGKEKGAGRMVRMVSHHLKLYSEYWTALSGDGESRRFCVECDGLRRFMVCSSTL